MTRRVSDIPVQWNIVVTPDKSTPLRGTKTSKPAELQVKITGSKIFTSVHWREGQLNYPLLPYLIPEPMESVYGKNHTKYWVLIQSIYCLPENPNLAL